MAIGKKVCHAECHATLDPVSMVLELRYKVTGARTTRTRTDDHNSYSTVCLTLRDGTLRQIMLYEGSTHHSDALETMDHHDDNTDQLGPLVVLHIYPTVENGLDQYRRQLDPHHDTKSAMRYLVLELREKIDLQRIMGLLSRLPENVERVDCTPENLPMYASSLLSNKRNCARATKRNAFLDGRPSDYALLVYPFAGDPTEMEEAADGLTEAAGTMTAGAAVTTPETGDEEHEGEGKSRHRAHFVTITVDDYDRLQPGEWLNDSLVDLWMQWYVCACVPSSSARPLALTTCLASVGSLETTRLSILASTFSPLTFTHDSRPRDQTRSLVGPVERTSTFSIRSSFLFRSTRPCTGLCAWS